ncbi:helix-turn-helix domain-containing protein [Ruminococcus sp. YRD2003]|uniref:helix-turn-helix domain-containing protein n=1 Tax=Ruminococcus sp. YRD2003 TaxID=1452313 RepID=UPI0009427E05
MNNSKLCLTVSEAAIQLNISRSKLYQLLRDGDIPHMKVGRKILIPSAELREWLHTQSTYSSNLKI